MVGTRATKRTKPQKEIKQEQDDEEEWQNSATPKRSCTEENALEKRKIKEEEEDDEEWSDEDEPSESDESIVDPDFDPKGRCFSDDSGDDLRKKRSSDGDDLRKQRNANVNRDNGGEELSWEFRSAPDDQPDPLTFKPASFADNSRDELCTRRNAEVNGNAGKEEPRWEFRSVPDTKPALLRFRPVRTPGPSLDTSSSWTPLSVFQSFCSTSVVRKIVENTNKNAVRKESGLMKKWTPITVKDFYLFLTTLLYMSLVRLDDECDYWKTVWLYDLPFPRNSMARDRYRQIRSALSLCDPEEDEENESKKGTPEYDKLFKIQPFYTQLVDACKAHFQPHRNICIHERMVRKSRPLKCGYRLFALADSLTGYTWNLHIDTGKTAATRGQTAGYTAAKNLLPPLAIGSGFTLYTESLFSSPRLFTELLDKHIGCCGVINKRHSKFPQNAKNDYTDPPSRGDIRWLRKGKLLFTKWVDTREVAMCSTVHEAFTGQVIRRPVKEGNGWRLKQFSCPDAVADFNRHMVVLKKSDLNFSYKLPCRIVDWHRFLFYHLLDLAMVNSFILYNELLKPKVEGRPLTEKEFREELCLEMHKFVRGSEPDVRDAPAAPAALCLPLYYVEGDATLGRRKCKICRALTPVYCQKCLIPLCLTCNRNCYKEWHELEESEKD